LVVVGDDLLHLSLGFAGQDEEYFRDSRRSPATGASRWQ
jgi:hypothetical protein